MLTVDENAVTQPELRWYGVAEKMGRFVVDAIDHVGLSVRNPAQSKPCARDENSLATLVGSIGRGRPDYG